MAKRRHSYAWTNHTSVANIPLYELSASASEGFEYAHELAKQARQWSNQNLLSHKPDTATTPLTPERLAAELDIPASTLRSRIAHARRELFGNLSDDAINKRAQRDKHRPRQQAARTARPTRDCDEPGCTQQLPADAHGNQHYCHRHRNGAARARRHRQRTQHAPATNREKTRPHAPPLTPGTPRQPAPVPSDLVYARA